MTAARDEITVGDTVAYSAAFGRSIGLDFDAMAARGTVTGLEMVGSAMIATVDWHGAELPGRILTANLARPGTVRFSDPSATPARIRYTRAP